jgi:UDPglucose 6-dehydrogenase
MKIGIIGFGYVGSAIGQSHGSDEVVINDPKMPNSVSKTEMLDCDAIYVCVPSPATEEGYCDSSILEDTIKGLLLVSLRKDIPIICKTTAPPSVYERLHLKYHNIVYSPEFLTARNHISDYKTTEVFILGGNIEYCEKARDVISQSNVSNKKFLLTDVKTASLFKYMMNSYLAMKVTFMNEFKQLADLHNVEWNQIRELAKYDRRIGRTHMHVPGPDGEYGWGGACFPKDIAAIQMEALDLDTELELLGKVEDINKKHRKLS